MEKIMQSIASIQESNDSRLRNEFINSYQPFIINCVSKTTNRYLNTTNDEEFIVGLEAFSEAIDKYNPEKGSFLNFAQLVINSRIKDYLKKETRYYSNVEYNDKKLLEFSEVINYELIQEVLTFRKKLLEFDIFLEDLVEVSPKQMKIRIELNELGEQIFKNKQLKNRLYKTKKLPITDIINQYETKRKRLKMFRKYIISIVVIFNEKLSHIEEYLIKRSDYDV